MINVLMRSPNSMDGVSLYRHYGPMLQLEEQGHVRLVAMNKDEEITHWHYYKKCQFAFINRPTTVFDHGFVMECKKHNLPIWVDVDDNIWELKDDNQAYLYYNESAKNIMRFAMENAQIVSVATATLQRYFSEKFRIPSIVIPNALDDDLVRFKQKFGDNKKVVWRGSQAGRRALEFYSRAIDELGVDFEFLFMGISPYWLKRQTNWTKPVNFIDYFLKLCNENPSFCFMTHLESEFDRTKSRNGWMEASMAGSVCLVPNFGEWSEIPNDMVFKYKPSNIEDFSYKLNKMVNFNKQELKEMNRKSIEFIETNYLLSEINRIRVKLIGDIINGERRGKG